MAIAKDLNVSKETAAQRYIKLHDENLAMVFSRDGLLRYVAKGDEFPRLCFWNGAQMPKLENAPAGKSITEMGDARSGEWLERPAGQYLQAQTLYQRDGLAMTLLHLIADEDNFEEKERDADFPRFR